jgi:RNA polymerase sigma-70 factor (ECF subfamily)
MKEYDKDRAASGAAMKDATHRALEQFLLYVSTRDAAGLERLLAEDVVSISDGGGETAAALQPIRGRDKVLRLILGLAAKSVAEPRFAFCTLNGLPAVLVEDFQSARTTATRYTIQIELNDQSRIRRLHVVIAPSKLTALSGRQS